VRLRALAPGKVNLCLFLGGTRADGRHELVTLFQSVSLADELLLSTLEDEERADEVICPGVEGPNLAADALAALRTRGWGAPAVRVEIRKSIPIAAGMAGGSADAAAVLRMAVELAPGRPEEVAAIAAELGADVPSQLWPGLAIGSGAGETVEPVPALAPHALLILPLPVALSTAAVYGEADRLGLGRSAGELEQRHRELRGVLRPGARLPAQLLLNDLQPAALSLCPAIAREAGADHALVCGSGPTVAGLYWGPDASQRAAAGATSLEERYPGATGTAPVPAGFGIPLFA
jgi:4-diphosphocytidyl-2-C-methyl-D-erythritol kinase